MKKAVLALSSIALTTTVFAGPMMDKKYYTMEFENVPAPTTDTQKTEILSSQWVKVNNKKYPISFREIIKTGTKIGNETFGAIKDAQGDTIQFEDGSDFVCKTSHKGSGPDHTSLHEVDGALFMVTQFECSPSAMYLTKLKSDKEGHLSPESISYIDQSAYKGGWVHCAGVATPWNSHLGSEEYEPNAAMIGSDGKINDEDGYYNDTALYFGNIKDSNPYYYGWTPEVKILSNKGDVDYTKHYAMGRFSHELAYIMPDQKTAYLTDDGTNVGLFMFVADRAKDMSAGTLYAAKFAQTGNQSVGEFHLKWISLGHATDADIKKYVIAKDKDDELTFQDMFEAAEPSSSGTCPTGFTSINTTWGQECLQVKPGMELAASRLETRRYAALKGATTELRKEEGVAYDADRGKLFIAISRVQYGMEDNKKKGKDNPKYDVGGNNDIRLEHNDCGAVYGLRVKGNQKDSTGALISSGYVAYNMKPEVVGIPKTYKEGPYAGNKCDVNSIAEPDNLTYINGSDTLIIGEDTGLHQIDYVWAFNQKTKKLTRIQTSPFGSETTSVFWYPDINNHGYMMSVLQHPYGESDKDKAKSKEDFESIIGYIGPFPPMPKD